MTEVVLLHMSLERMGIQDQTDVLVRERRKEKLLRLAKVELNCVLAGRPNLFVLVRDKSTEQVAVGQLGQHGASQRVLDILGGHLPTGVKLHPMPQMKDVRLAAILHLPAVL